MTMGISPVTLLGAARAEGGDEREDEYAGVEPKCVPDQCDV